MEFTKGLVEGHHLIKVFSASNGGRFKGTILITGIQKTAVDQETSTGLYQVLQVGYN